MIFRNFRSSKIFRGFLIVLIPIFPLHGSASPLGAYEPCYKTRAKKIPTVHERQFVDAYMTYLKNGSAKNGEAAIEKMQALAKEQGGRFSTKWAGVFEGSMELCCGGPDSCSESLGSMTGKILYPRVEKGQPTAIHFVLLYKRLAKVDGAEAENLQEFTELIHEEHAWALPAFEKKYPPN